MLSEIFQEVYNIFKMNFYKSMCDNTKELTMQEAFSLDIIYMLGKPTILEYATYMNISQPNATYKINQMIDKGYLTKKICNEDKRSFRLQVTQKFLDCYRDNDRFIKQTLNGIDSRFNEQEVELLKKLLTDIKKQLL